MSLFGSHKVINSPHRKGNLKDGTAAPGAVVTPPAAPKNDPAPKLTVVSTGDGNVIVDAFEDKIVPFQLNVVRNTVSSAGMFLGTVLGGNTPDTAVTDKSFSGKDAVPSKSAAMALPVPITVDGAIQSDPSVEVDNWSKYLLPVDYKDGDALPVLPWGLSYVKLDRMSKFGAYAWDAGIDSTIKPSDAGQLLFVSASVKTSDLNLITVMFTREVKITPFKNILSHIFVFDLNKQQHLKVQSVSVSKNAVSLTMSALSTIDPLGSYVLTIIGGAFSAVTGWPAATNDTIGNAPVTLKMARNSVIVAVNRRAYQTFFAGDLVHLANDSFSSTDSKGVSKALPDIVSNASSLRSPHSHAYARFDAGASPLGASTTRA